MMITTPSSSVPFPEVTPAAPVAPPLIRNTVTLSLSLPVALVLGLIIGNGIFKLPQKPKLNNGVNAYTKASSGKDVGFKLAWSHWVSARIGKFSYLMAGGAAP